MVQKVMIAGVQMEPKILEKKYNLEKIINFCKEAHKNGAKLVVFPECALTGYCFSNLDETLPMSEPIPGPSTDSLQNVCRELNILILVGLIERERNQCFNAATLIASEGIIGNYRKIHLPFLGLDRFVNKGDIPFKVYDTKVGKLGWVICYDNSFPETIRILTLKGAELVALPTNWPEGVENTAKYIVPARAVENRINYIAVNRVGKERGFRFFGDSKIIDYSGKILAEAGSEKEEIIYAEVDLEKAREKRQVLIPGELELDRLKDRRPEFYGPLIDPNL
jgi:predicted amidohydrolase